MPNDRCDDIANWSNITEDADCSFDVAASWQGRNLVLECIDENNGGKAAGDQEFSSSQTSGRIYVHIGSSDVSLTATLWMKSDQTYVAGLLISSENMYYYDGTWHTFKAISDNTWYDVEITFECGDGGYDGLSADTYYIYVDSTRYGPFNFSKAVNNMVLVRLTTNTSGFGYCYLDSLYYSWDGWEHDFIGVANADIDKINGISKTDISKINGV